MDNDVVVGPAFDQKRGAATLFLKVNYLELPFNNQLNDSNSM